MGSSEEPQRLISGGYAFSSFELKISDDDGIDLSTTMLDPIVPWRDGDWTKAAVRGGTDGEDYYLRLRITLTKSGYPDEKIEADLLIQVREKGE